MDEHQREERKTLVEGKWFRKLRERERKEMREERNRLNIGRKRQQPKGKNEIDFKKWERSNTL